MFNFVIGFLAGAATATAVPYVYDAGKWLAAKAVDAYRAVRAWLDFKAKP